MIGRTIGTIVGLASLWACTEHVEAPRIKDPKHLIRIAISTEHLEWLGPVEYEIFRGDEPILAGRIDEDREVTCDSRQAHWMEPGEYELRFEIKSENGWEWPFTIRDNFSPRCSNIKLAGDNSIIPLVALMFEPGYKMPVTIWEDETQIGQVDLPTSIEKFNEVSGDFAVLMRWMEQGGVAVFTRPPGIRTWELRTSDGKRSNIEVEFTPTALAYSLRNRITAPLSP